MKFLYVGDIMGEVGIATVEQFLPSIRRQNQVNIVIAQAENVSNGRGISLKDFQHLKSIGIDFFTGGNWTLHNEEIFSSLSDPAQPIIRPANYPAGTPGLGYKYLESKFGKVLIISLLGRIVGKDSDKSVDNPLKVIDNILDQEKDVSKIATIVNFHGDYSSEKRTIGYYLDGKVSAVIGDHWHIPTADAGILTRGTAHITDVGMCGSLDSSLGVSFESVIPRWHDNQPTRNQLETSGRCQFNALLIEVDQSSGLATSAELIQRYN